jgi:hypothetical protein
MKKSGKLTEERKDGLEMVEYLYHIDPTMERLKLPAFAVWSSLLDLRFEKTPVVSASRRRIMAASGIRSKDTVTRALVELETKGYISRMSACADDRRTPNYFLYENPERPKAPKPVSPGKTADWPNRPIDFMGTLNIQDLENAVRKAVGMPALPDEGTPPPLENSPSFLRHEEGQTGPAQGKDRATSEARPDREMGQTGPGERTDQATGEDRPDREMGRTGLFADPQ